MSIMRVAGTEDHSDYRVWNLRPHCLRSWNWATSGPIMGIPRVLSVFPAESNSFPFKRGYIAFGNWGVYFISVELGAKVKIAEEP